MGSTCKVLPPLDTLDAEKPPSAHRPYMSKTRGKKIKFMSVKFKKIISKIVAKTLSSDQSSRD